MDDHRLGFLGPSSLIAGLLTLLITAGIWTTHGGTLFSPGPLDVQKGQPIQGVSSHADLQGKCSACHANLLEPGSMDERCEACHTDIAGQKGNPNTLHGDLLKTNGSLECRNCHQEHGGALTDIRKANVDHAAFGYSLAGHAAKADGTRFTCKDCHARGFVTFDVGVCATCHQQKDASFLQPHMQAFGSDCLGCHGGLDPYGSHFDHNRYGFQLTGNHAGVSCYQCHQTAQSPADLQKTPADCAACHAQQNPHSARLGTNCASCHTTANWQTATFDHSLTAYPLTGMHAQAACTDCHKNNVYRGTPTDCYSCHQADDDHHGQNTTQCSLCHTDSAWSPTLPFDHNAFAFKLTGAHASTPCTSCHTNNDFKKTPTTCESCHKNPHGSPIYEHCGYCHSPYNW